MSRRLRRWTHKFAGESGYQRIAGDLEVQGNIIGPSMSLIGTAIDKLACATTTPVVLTITRCEGQYKGIILQWSVQYNLANLSHYELQVSSDQTDWYSLKSDGTGWRGTINLDTDVEGPLFVHTPIPFDGTAEEPVAVKLYYRMRQKTILGVVCAWSAITSATTSLVDNGDVLANTLTGNKIVAGSISAREMSFGTDALSIPVFEDTDPANLTAHLFDLSQPDCVANTGILPASGREIVYAPATSIDETLKEYPHPWSPRLYGQSEAIFATRTNLVVDPENLTTANWSNNDSTDALSDLYVRNHRLTKVVATVAGGYVRQDVSFASDGKKSLQLIIRKGNDDATRVILVDTTTWTVSINFYLTFSTKTLTPTAGETIHDYEWIDDDTLWISFISAALSSAHTHRVAVYSQTAVGSCTYYTAIQVEDAIYPSPYIDKFRWPAQVRPAVRSDYAVTMPAKFVFKIKVRPWFIYDTTTYHRTFEWYIDAAHRLISYYNHTVDKLALSWVDGGTNRILYTEQFDNGTSYDDINSEIVLFGSIDLTTQTGNNRFFAIVAGSKQTEATNWAGVPDALASSFMTLSLGHETGVSIADSLVHSAEFWSWDGTALGTLNDEADIDRVTAGLTSLFSWEGEDYDVGYKPTGKQGAVGLFKATTNLASDPEDLTGAAWAETTVTPTLSDYYIDGKRFSKLLATAANGYSSQTIAFTGDGVKSVQCFLRRGTDTTTTLVLRDTTAPADRLRIVVTWATKAFAETTGSVFNYAWLNDDILWIACLTSSVTAANTNSLRIEIDTDATYSYITAIQAENSVYPTPYTPTSRVIGELNYPLELPRKFTALFWLRPWFNYDTADSTPFLTWYVAANNVFLIYYVPATDKITVEWMDGGVARSLQGPTLNSAALLNQHIMVAATIDLDGGQTGSMLKVYAGATIGSDKDWGGAPDTKTTSFPTLAVGCDPSAGVQMADSFLTDLLILPGVLLTEVQCDEHFNKTRPWYSTSEVASNNKQVRIDRSGIRLHNAQINITDWRNRQILISNRDGLLARDAGGKVIHDIPNAPILTDMIYGGHLIVCTASTFFSTYALSYSDVAVNFDTTALVNVNMSNYLPAGLTNAKGFLVYIRQSLSVHSSKVDVGTQVTTVLNYATVYNTSPGNANPIREQSAWAVVAGVGLSAQSGSIGVIPVVWNGATPYITYKILGDWNLMLNANNYYAADATLYLLGVFV